MQRLLISGNRLPLLYSFQIERYQKHSNCMLKIRNITNTADSTIFPELKEFANLDYEYSLLEIRCIF